MGYCTAVGVADIAAQLDNWQRMVAHWDGLAVQRHSELGRAGGPSAGDGERG